jgi:signal transduction protein with GAF and PtsI domain
MDDDTLARLQRIADFAESEGSLADNLAELARLAATAFEAERCSIMLFSAGDGDAMRLRVVASHGDLPAAARDTLIARGEGIAGRVAESGEAIVIEDIMDSPLAGFARRPRQGRPSLMAAPIRIQGKVIGVMNLAGPRAARTFTPADLATLEVVARFAAKTIQVIQLQNLLQSRFAQLALARDAERAVGSAMLGAAYDPDKMAKIVAKSFFREMTRAGFDAGQIIGAASEIISQLSTTLNRHGKRRDRQ